MIVLDASAALPGLMNAGPAREVVASQQVHAPHLVDSEIANGLRRQVASTWITTDNSRAALDAWRARHCRAAVTSTVRASGNGPLLPR